MDATQTFRNSTYPVLGWTVVGFLALTAAGMGIGACLTSLGLALALAVGALTAGALGWFVHRTYVRSCIIADNRGITVLNPVRTWRFTWSEIARFRAGSMLTVYPKARPPVRVFAVEAAHAARLLGRESSADRVATELNRRLVEARGGDWEAEAIEFAPITSQRAAMRGAAIGFLVFALIWVIVRIVIGR